MRIEYHRTLIADTVRNEAFYAALKSVIVPGKTVVADIGAGSGLLGLMASKLGAKSVYLFETAEVGAVAEKILKANKAKNCHLIPCHSTEFDDKLQVDVIVSETLGNYALEENIVDTLNDARKRFLKPGGQTIPSRIMQFVVPVVVPRLHDELHVWQKVGGGIDFGIAQVMSCNNVYVRTMQPKELLGGGKSALQWDAIDLTREERSARKGEGSFKVEKAQTIFGFSYWWDLQLSTGVSLSTGPNAPATHWEQLYFPLMQPIALKAGDSVGVILKTRSSENAGTHLAWTAIHLDARGKEVARQVMDLDKGYLP